MRAEQSLYRGQGLDVQHTNSLMASQVNFSRPAQTVHVFRQKLLAVLRR